MHTIIKEMMWGYLIVNPNLSEATCGKIVNIRENLGGPITSTIYIDNGIHSILNFENSEIAKISVQNILETYFNGDSINNLIELEKVRYNLK